MDINIDELQKICLDFFRLAGMGFSLWDENRNNIFSYPHSHGPFCTAVRCNQTLAQKCTLSDSKGLDEVNKTKQPYIYTCHMGLTEAIVPILQDEEIVGYLMMGQIVENENRTKIEERIYKSTNDPEYRDVLLKSIDENLSSDADKINYCINVLKVMIDYMNLSYVIQKSTESTYSKAKRYINNNLSKPILPRDICKEIGVSENTLYKAIKSKSGISPTELIRNSKITQAKILLSNTDSSVAKVADDVGIPDVNYFIRIFKKQVGLSPLKYKKNTKTK